MQILAEDRGEGLFFLFVLVNCGILKWKVASPVVASMLDDHPLPVARRTVHCKFLSQI